VAGERGAALAVGGTALACAWRRRERARRRSGAAYGRLRGAGKGRRAAATGVGARPATSASDDQKRISSATKFWDGIWTEIWGRKERKRGKILVGILDLRSGILGESEGWGLGRRKKRKGG
jgi:hypothetical protein